MRSLFIFGAIAIFFAAAFVPPSDANFRAQAQSARKIVEQRTAAALVSSMPSGTDLAQTAKLLSSIAKSANASAVVDALGMTSPNIDSSLLLSKAANVFASAAPSPINVVKTVTRLVARPHPAAPSKEWTSLIQTEQNPMLKKQLERIDWAAQRSDLRACNELSIADYSVSGGNPSVGDLIALCVAKVTRDAARCGQIDATTTLPLKSICEEELAS